MAQYYQNLSGTRSNYVDGNLSVQADSQGPITLAVGTAEKGPSFVTRRVLFMQMLCASMVRIQSSAAVFSAKQQQIRGFAYIVLVGAEPPLHQAGY